MATASAPNPRASLLAGLRTGGVRSTSTTIPHTASLGASFNIPRFASQYHSFPLLEDEEDQVVDMPAFPSHFPGNRAVPMTAAVDGPNNRFATQQTGQRSLNPMSAPFNPNVKIQSNQMHNQTFQMQMLQLEMMRIQNLQAQQLQAEILAQAQLQQQQSQMQSQSRRASLVFNPPSTAGPFDLRSATLSAQMRRANQTEPLNPPLAVRGDDQLPMTAGFGSKFGTRAVNLSTSDAVSRFTSEEYDSSLLPSIPCSTTVISGGTPLGNISSKAVNNSSKSDSVTSWRRDGNNNSVLRGNKRAVSSPSVNVPPPGEQPSTAPSFPSAAKFRPQPLRFSGAIAHPLPSVTVIDTSDSNDDASSSSSVGSNSSPNTPSSNGAPLSPREEASKKLYEGLGIGRPASTVSDHQHPYVASVASHRTASQPTRQPRGPPSGADELGPKNFATRIRRQAIDGLGMLMGARERRELLEVY